jgi:hypothetical protein
MLTVHWSGHPKWTATVHTGMKAKLTLVLRSTEQEHMEERETSPPPYTQCVTLASTPNPLGARPCVVAAPRRPLLACAPHLLQGNKRAAVLTIPLWQRVARCSVEACAPRWSPLRGHNVRLDLAVHVDGSEPLGDRCCRALDGFAKTRGVTRLDLVAERRSQAIRHRWDAARGCLTARCDRDHVG